MKTPFFHFVLCLIVSCLSYITNNQTVAAPPSTVEDFCGVVDYKLDNRNYARSMTANLNVGEPRTVRLIYFLPNDRPYREDVVQRIKDEIRNIQTFYAESMQAHGYDMTFQIETDSQGEPVVHRVDGQYPYSYYRDLPFGLQVFTSAIRIEIRDVFDLRANVYVCVIDNGENTVYGVGGIGIMGSKSSGRVYLPSQFSRKIIAHELGHAFGLQHDFRDNAFIMSYSQKRNQLSPCSARYLSVHPYFNSDARIDGSGPAINLISSKRYPLGERSVPIQLKVRSRTELHQAILFVNTRRPHSAAGSREVKMCRELAGEKEVIIEFDYDGVTPSNDNTNLSSYTSHPMYVIVVDKDGGRRGKEFSVVESSPHLITTFQSNERTNGHYMTKVNSVSFSPDGATVALGASSDGTIKLWDVATQQIIDTFSEGYWGYVSPVLFSPDGTTIAANSTIFTPSGSNSTVKLWDVESRQKITILNTQNSAISFSPDGAIIALGAASDGTITLWDVAIQQIIDTLEGHTTYINSVSFSPDGSMLASNSSDGTIKLWDVTTRQIIDTLRPTAGSVSFSPDGNILASGSHQGIRLWDVTTRKNIDILGDWLFKVSFSPDGTIIAASSGHFIHLWDVATQTEITTFVHTDYVRGFSISPDGTTLVSGTSDGKVELWDISGMIQPHLEATESPSIIADVNADGVINILDLVTIANHISNGTFDAMADVNGDGVVSILDLVLVAGMFEEAAAAPSAQPQVPETLTAVEVQDWLTDARAVEIRDPIMKRGFVVLKQLLVSLTPTKTELLSNYPNPFNPETWIPFRLAEDANVTLTIYDVEGKEVRRLNIGHSKAGIYESRDKAIYWDGKNDLGESVASGVYFYHLTAGGYSATRRMVILK